MERPTMINGNKKTLLGPELKVGDPAPDFLCIDNSFQEINLARTGSGVRIFSVVSSLDTNVCDMQTKRLADETAKMPGVGLVTISMDLPFAQRRWCDTFGVDEVKMLSDHRFANFGEAYGTLIKEQRIESRALFVVDGENKIRYVEYVPELGDQPNYEAALEVAKSLL